MCHLHWGLHGRETDQKNEMTCFKPAEGESFNRAFVENQIHVLKNGRRRPNAAG